MQRPPQKVHHFCAQNNTRQDSTMIVPLVNQCIHCKRDFWPECPMQGMSSHPTPRGSLDPSQATLACFQAEIIDPVARKKVS